MATIAPTITQLEPRDGSVLKYTWVLTGTDDGAPIPFAQWSDRSVQFVGTWGGGTVVFEGSNNGGTTYATLNDAQAIREALEHELAAVLDAGACPLQASTVIDLTPMGTGGEPEVIRLGRGGLAALGLA